jgi:hypothetical protein
MCSRLFAIVFSFVKFALAHPLAQRAVALSIRAKSAGTARLLPLLAILALAHIWLWNMSPGRAAAIGVQNVGTGGHIKRVDVLDIGNQLSHSHISIPE